MLRLNSLINASSCPWKKNILPCSIEPEFGHLKNDHRMNRNWLKGEVSDAMQVVYCANRYNVLCPMWALLTGVINPVYFPDAGAVDTYF
jgi:hypothetical protein